MSFHWKLCLKKTFRQTYVFVYHVVHCLRLLYHFGHCLFVELILSANFSYSISTSSFCPSSSCNISLSRWHGSFVWAPQHTYPSIRGTCCETHADMWVVCFDIWHMVLRSHLSNIHHLGAHSGTYIHTCVCAQHHVLWGWWCVDCWTQMASPQPPAFVNVYALV